jgi:hypothetical protein
MVSKNLKGFRKSYFIFNSFHLLSSLENIFFLLSEPKYISCVRLSHILENLSHDSINRFLITQKYEPQDLCSQVKEFIVLEGGTLSVDDMVLDFPVIFQSRF